jgi:hypothetical protein
MITVRGHRTLGITLLSSRWIDAVWSKWYEVIKVVPGESMICRTSSSAGADFRRKLKISIEL